MISRNYLKGHWYAGAGLGGVVGTILTTIVWTTEYGHYAAIAAVMILFFADEIESWEARGVSEDE